MKKVSSMKPEKELTERQQQQLVMKWAKEHSEEFPELKLLYHIPNERICSPKYGKLLKLAGVRSGIPDLHLPIARAGFHGLYIEMKTPGGCLTDNQKEWIDKLNQQNYKAVACYSYTDAIETLRQYLTQSEAVTNRGEC